MNKRPRNGAAIMPRHIYTLDIPANEAVVSRNFINADCLFRERRDVFAPPALRYSRRNIRVVTFAFPLLTANEVIDIMKYKYALYSMCL